MEGAVKGCGRGPRVSYSVYGSGGWGDWRELKDAPKRVAKLLAVTGVVSSVGSAERLIEAGAVRYFKTSNEC